MIYNWSWPQWNTSVNGTESQFTFDSNYRILFFLHWNVLQPDRRPVHCHHLIFHLLCHLKILVDPLSVLPFWKRKTSYRPPLVALNFLLKMFLHCIITHIDGETWIWWDQEEGEASTGLFAPLNKTSFQQIYFNERPGWKGDRSVVYREYSLSQIIRIMCFSYVVLDHWAVAISEVKGRCQKHSITQDRKRDCVKMRDWSDLSFHCKMNHIQALGVGEWFDPWCVSAPRDVTTQKLYRPNEWDDSLISNIWIKYK